MSILVLLETVSLRISSCKWLNGCVSLESLDEFRLVPRCSSQLPTLSCIYYKETTSFPLREVIFQLNTNIKAFMNRQSCNMWIRQPLATSFFLVLVLTFDVNIRTTIQWFAIQFLTNCDVPQRMNPSDFADPLIFCLVPPQGWDVCFCYVSK